MIGTDSAVFHKWWDGTKWGPSTKDWECLGGIFIFEPVAVAWGPDRLDVFAIGTDSALYHKWWDGCAWRPNDLEWERLGGIWMEKPAVVSWAPNRLDVFVVGSNRSLYQKYWDGSRWNDGFIHLDGRLLSAPSVVSWAPNRINIFGTATSSAIIHKYWDGQRWGPSGTSGDWENIGGIVYGPPKAVCWGTSCIDLFVIGMDAGLHHKWWDGKNWGPDGATGGWERMAGTIQRIPEVVAWRPSRVNIFVIGTNSAVYHKWHSMNGGWGPSLTEYEQMGGIFKDVIAIPWSDERLDVFATGTDGVCYHKSWKPSIGGWKPSLAGPWENLGRPCTSTVTNEIRALNGDFSFSICKNDM